MSVSITHETYIPYPPQRVWRALTERDALAAWLMPNDFAPHLGGEFTFRTNPMPAIGFDGICHCRVTAFDAPSRLAYTWEGGAVHTTVTYQLEPEGAGTRLRFSQGSFDETDPLQAGSYHGLRGGWGPILDTRLPQVIAAQGEQG